MPIDEETGRRRFPYAHEVEFPEELEGWEEMYPEHFLPAHDEEAREYEDGEFWIQDPNVGRRPLRPWDLTIQESLYLSYPQNMSRVLPLPDTLTMDARYIAGYLYFTLVPIRDDELVQERLPIFEERFEYQAEHFDELYEEVWKPHVKEIIEEMRALEIPEELPRYVSDEFVTESHGTTDVTTIVESYHGIVEGLHAGWQRHFEFMNMAYGCYMEFFDTCKEIFPDVPDQSIAQMTSALDVDMYRPDEEINDLAHLAEDLGSPVTDILRGDDEPEEKLDQLEDAEAGRAFLEAFEEAKDPWFYMSYGNGYYSEDGAWIDDLQAPFDHLRTKLDRLADGEDIDRDLEALAEEREAIYEEYRTYVTDDEDLERFDALYEQCQQVYRYLDDHIFWIDHYLDMVAFEKMREIGQLLVNHDLLDDPDDVFYFTQYEVAELLTELGITWGHGQDAYVSQRWKAKAAERAEIHEAAKEWDQPLALGLPPEAIEDTLYRSHMGITTEKVERWLDEREGATDVDAADSVIEGFAASQGVVEGVCRVVMDAQSLDQVQEGDILVAPATNPSWSPAFSRIAAAVTDSGGITHHAATVCREYGLPAVVGTEVATSRLRSGDRVRVDGSNGLVEIIERVEG